MKYQKESSCKEYSILSHSDAISNCFNRSFSGSAFAKFELFRNKAFINSAFVSGIFPLFILVKISIESSSFEVSNQMTFVKSLNFNSNDFSTFLSWNHFLIVGYAVEMWK